MARGEADIFGNWEDDGSTDILANFETLSDAGAVFDEGEARCDSEGEFFVRNARIIDRDTCLVLENVRGIVDPDRFSRIGV